MGIWQRDGWHPKKGGLSVEEFDAELRRWSRTPGGQVRGGNEVTYEKEAIRMLRLGQ